MRIHTTATYVAVLLIVYCTPTDAQQVDFERQLAPLLTQRCLPCHNANEDKGGLNLSSSAALLEGGDTGPSVIPSVPDESWLLEWIVPTTDGLAPRMPKKGVALSADEVQLLRRWIGEGANWPDGLVLRQASKANASWWSLQPLEIIASTSQLPHSVWAAGQVDGFIESKLKEQQLLPAESAEKQMLIRRLSFDLLGLPPVPDEVTAFISDESPDAYERLVDRMLGSPRYGERWARHWLDVVRFAESDGFETNQPRPNAWPFRDYVIRSFNADKPYDQFIVEQLAGDSLGKDEATGFVVGGAYDRVKSPDPVLTAQQRAEELHDMVSTTSSTFLGLTVGCARCHDHKFDPILQNDYYALKACFSGVQHGDRAVRPADYLDRQATAAELRRQLEPLEAALRGFEPTASPARVLLLDETTPGSSDINRPFVSDLIPPQGSAVHAAGKERGELDDPGNSGRFPNLSKSYKWWMNAKNKNVFAWTPKINGPYRIWLSWGCGWQTHAADARYLLDRDGDLETVEDQTEIARIDQRLFADGTGDIPNKPIWSDFRWGGDHVLTVDSRIVLRGGETDAPITADVLMFQECMPETDPANAETPTPRVRVAVSRGVNVERFQPITAKYLRFTVRGTTQSEPCIDELEMFSAEAVPRNVAAQSAGAVLSASSTLPGYDMHKLQHLNDGKYGNDWSWISNEPGGGWVQVQFAQVENIDRVIWSRDRSTVPRFEDRVATDYSIEVSRDGTVWEAVASSADRLPFGFSANGISIVTNFALSAAERHDLSQLTSRRHELQQKVQQLTSSPMVYAGKFSDPEPTFRLHRGDPTQPREPISPGVLTAFGPPFILSTTAGVAERRLALAHWIADERNPLTARVFVNRLWHYHFGRGIVDTPSDFGFGGGRPTHPQLLDWLARELMRTGWSSKTLQRNIVLSSTFRQSSRVDVTAQTMDNEGRLLWRYPPRRLEAESLRDAVLAVAGSLDLRMGGAGFDLFVPNTNYVKVYDSKREFGPDTFRRMVYQSKPRMQLDDTFGTFDCPDAGQIAPRRNSSITPLQALNLLNSPFIMQQSVAWSEKLKRDAGHDSTVQIRLAFLTAFARLPRPEEAVAAERLVRQHGLAVFCRALFSANEFLFVF